jgi:hypothetical protein
VLVVILSIKAYQERWMQAVSQAKELQAECQRLQNAEATLSRKIEKVGVRSPRPSSAKWSPS